MCDRDFVRRQKEDRPVVAICYDFDRTLSPDDMQAQGYIQSVDYKAEDFWKESNALAGENDMDQNLAWMYMMKRTAEGQVLFTKESFAAYGAKVALFPGVEDWFRRIKVFGAECGVIVEHYIISSGLKEMIEGTSVARQGAFEKIYASSFYYNEKGVAVWPAQVVNYTNKTQFLFRIEKGVLDINDGGVNGFFPPEKLRVPFRNMIYIGDSDTDIPCMKLVNTNGGHSIGVYDPDMRDKGKVYRMMRDKRIKYYAAADYREGSELDGLVKKIISRTAANEELESVHYQKMSEYQQAAARQDGADQRKLDLIDKLAESDSFANSHMIVRELAAFSDWREEEREELLRIALANSQVRYILTDADIRRFFARLVAENGTLSANGREVRELLQG